MASTILAFLFAALSALAPDERVSVDGVDLPELRIRRVLLEMYAGDELDALQMRILLAQAIERIGTPGDPRHGLDAFGELGVDELIDRVFFPEDPALWPDFAQYGIDGETDRMQFEGFRQRMLRVRAGDPQAKPRGELEMPIVRGRIRNGLMRTQDIRRCGPLLADDVVLAVGAHRVRVGELWPGFAPRVTPLMRRTALRWAAVSFVLERELQRIGAGLDFAAWRDRWIRENSDMAATNFAVKAREMARTRVPSVDAYRRYLWLLESYRSANAQRLEGAEFATWARENESHVGRGQVSAEVILFAAWDFAARAPLGDAARTAARERAEACWTRLQAGEDFGALLEELSEYGDLPSLSMLGGKPTIETHRGRFGLRPYLALATLLGEAPFEALLGGERLAWAVFSELEPGVAAAPRPCTYGWAIARVLERRAPRRRVLIELPTVADAVRSLMAEELFLDWAAETLSRSEIRIR